MKKRRHTSHIPHSGYVRQHGVCSAAQPRKGGHKSVYTYIIVFEEGSNMWFVGMNDVSSVWFVQANAVRFARMVACGSSAW